MAGMERRWRVLVIEDNVMLRRLWTATVSAELREVEVREVATEKEAMHCIMGGEFDVVVSGYYFSPPERDGGFKRILTAIREMGRRIPVIFMSDYVLPETRYGASEVFSLADLG